MGWFKVYSLQLMSQLKQNSQKIYQNKQTNKHMIFLIIIFIIEKDECKWFCYLCEFGMKAEWVNKKQSSSSKFSFLCISISLSPLYFFSLFLKECARVFTSRPNINRSQATICRQFIFFKKKIKLKIGYLFWSGILGGEKGNRRWVKERKKMGWWWWCLAINVWEEILMGMEGLLRFYIVDGVLYLFIICIM